MASWKKWSPKWKIILLMGDVNPSLTIPNVEIASVYKYLEKGKDLPSCFPSCKNAMPAHAADMVRLGILAKHGGGWVDGSSVMLQDLDKWISQPTIWHGIAW